MLVCFHPEECGGWRRELDDDEVCEYYMDAKFGGEDADRWGRS